MLESISKKRVLINVSGSIFFKFTNIFFVFWLYQYLLKRIPEDEFAIYPVLIIIMMIVPLLSSFFASALSRSIIQAYVDKAPEQVTILHTTIVFGLLLFGTALLLSGLTCSLFIEHIIRVPPGLIAEAQLMTAFLVLDLCMSLFGTAFIVAFEVRQRFIQRDMIFMAMELLRMALLFFLLVFVSTRIIWLPISNAAVTFISLWLFIFQSRRLLPEFRLKPRLFDTTILGHLISFGVWTSLGQLSTLLYQNSGSVLLNLFSTPLQVTNYFLGSVFDRRIGSTMSVALAPLQPVLTTMSMTKDFSRLGNTFLRGGRYALWTAMAVVTPLMVFADDFIVIYVGEKYLDAALVVALLVAPIPFTYATIMLSRVAIAVGDIKAFFSGAIITSLSGVVLMWAGLKFFGYGAIGAAVSITFVMIVSHLFFFWPLGLRLARVSFRQFLNQTLFPGLIPAMSGFCFWLPVKLIHPPETWFELIASGAFGGCFYIAALGIWCLQPDEKRSALKMWRSIQPSR